MVTVLNVDSSMHDFASMVLTDFIDAVIPDTPLNIGKLPERINIGQKEPTGISC